MSQKRQKKQLTTYDNVFSMTDQELREALKTYNQAPGPITDSTRNLYRKKLISLIDDGSGNTSKASPTGVVPGPPYLANDGDGDDDEDTSDEEFIVREEDLEDSDDDEEESDESESEEDEDEDEDEFEEDESAEDEDLDNSVNEFGDEIKLSSTTNENLTTSMMASSDSTPNRISRGILILLVSFFVAIFSFYLFSSNNYKLLIPSQPFKNLTKQLVILIGLTYTIGYVAYRIFRSYRLRRHQELQRVSDLVTEALELLQSPDNPNPKGLMPILHIRDTLLIPAERKTRSAINLWAKAVKFIEEHESRVKVELVNIDGEDFRAWKWIGTNKKL